MIEESNKDVDKKIDKSFQFTKYLTIIFTFVFSYFAWWSVNQAINVPGSSTWLIPIFWFILVFMMVCLDFLLVREEFIVAIVLCVVAGMSLIFTFNIGQLLAVIISFLILYAAARRIRNDMNLNIRISPWKSIRQGRIHLITAMAILISTMYFFQIINSNNEQVVPQFHLGKWSEPLVQQTLSSFNPAFEKLESENVTVDEMILQSSNEPSGPNEDNQENINQALIEEFGEEAALFGEQLTSGVSQSLGEMQEELMLQEGRKKFSELAGREIKGDEEMTVVITEIINNQINQFFRPSVNDSQFSSIGPMVFAILLFLTIIAVGPLVALPATILVVAIFRLLTLSKVVLITKITTEREVIDQ